MLPFWHWMRALYFHSHRLQWSKSLSPGVFVLPLVLKRAPFISASCHQNHIFSLIHNFHSFLFVILDFLIVFLIFSFSFLLTLARIQHIFLIRNSFVGWEIHIEIKRSVSFCHIVVHADRWSFGFTFIFALYRHMSLGQFARTLISPVTEKNIFDSCSIVARVNFDTFYLCWFCIHHWNLLQLIWLEFSLSVCLFRRLITSSPIVYVSEFYKKIAHTNIVIFGHIPKHQISLWWYV